VETIKPVVVACTSEVPMVVTYIMAPVVVTWPVMVLPGSVVTGSGRPVLVLLRVIVIVGNTTSWALSTAGSPVGTSMILYLRTQLRTPTVRRKETPTHEPGIVGLDPGTNASQA
jgi:hypothetical protein